MGAARWATSLGLAVNTGVRTRNEPRSASESALPPPPEQTPEQLLKAFFYGDYIHWDRSSEQIEAWSTDPLDNAVYRLFFLRAISQLAAVYVPVADVVSTALRAIEDST